MLSRPVRLTTRIGLLSTIDEDSTLRREEKKERMEVRRNPQVEERREGGKERLNWKTDDPVDV